MLPEALVLPRGVRYPTIEEIPGGAPSDAAARVAEAQRTSVTTGYVCSARLEAVGYTHVLEANVHAPRLWAVFSGLVEALLPNVAAPIVGVIDEEPIHGPYTTKTAALAALFPYADPLTHDGFLEFGCMFQHRGQTEEVFVPSAKFLRIWTNQPTVAKSVLEAHNIPEHPALRFIDEFPLVREAQEFRGESSGWFTVAEELRRSFESLPEPSAGSHA